MLNKARYNPQGKRLLLALATVLFGVVAYIGMVTAATPTSFTFEASMGMVNGNDPAMMQTIQDLQLENQELQQTLQNGSPHR